LCENVGYGISAHVSPYDKPLVVLSGDIKTPPLSEAARLETGYLLRLLQKGEVLSLPHSRPMPSIGPRVHELRIQDPATSTTWRIVYRADPAEIVVVDVFAKKTQATPKLVIERCKVRLRRWDHDEERS
jgi:phage-related protein